MLSSIFLSGRLGKARDEDTREVLLERLIPGPTGHLKVDRIPVKAPLSLNARFMKAPEGSLIVLKGRLELDEEGHLIIVDEIDEIFQPAEKA